MSVEEKKWEKRKIENEEGAMVSAPGKSSLIGDS